MRFFADAGTPKGLQNDQEFKSLVKVVSDSHDDPSLVPLCLKTAWADALSTSSFVDESGATHPLGHLRAFVDEIEPTWEDPANQAGGKWAVRVEKAHSRALFAAVVARISGADLDRCLEAVGVDPRSLASWSSSQAAAPAFSLARGLCGCVLTMRPQGDQIHLWNADSSDMPGRAATLTELVALATHVGVPETATDAIVYHVHGGTLDWNRDKARAGKGKAKGKGKGKGKAGPPHHHHHHHHHGHHHGHHHHHGHQARQGQPGQHGQVSALEELARSRMIMIEEVVKVEVVKREEGRLGPGRESARCFLKQFVPKGGPSASL
jgi:hypothetical protein